MAERMLKFVSVARRTPEKRAAKARTGDFHEIYADFIDAKAKEQASRCSQCGIPFCQTHCPLHNNIPDWLRMTAEGRLQEAYELSQATSALPEVCGRICPQDRLCEGSCVIEQSGHGTVTIGSVERYINDKAWEMGWVKPLAPIQELPQSVGIIGAGPAGLSAADGLRVVGPFAEALAGADGNLVMRAVAAFRARWPRAIAAGLALTLHKNLPVAAGLGGGSADAAAALRLMAALSREPVAAADLMAVAATLGADVPMCLMSRPSIALGIGEVVKPLLAFYFSGNAKMITQPLRFPNTCTGASARENDLAAKHECAVERLQRARIDLRRRHRTGHERERGFGLGRITSENSLGGLEPRRARAPVELRQTVDQEMKVVIAAVAVGGEHGIGCG